jgi:hypothetical protein
MTAADLITQKKITRTRGISVSIKGIEEVNGLAVNVAAHWRSFAVLSGGADLENGRRNSGSEILRVQKKFHLGSKSVGLKEK